MPKSANQKINEKMSCDLMCIINLLDVTNANNAEINN